MTKKDNVKENLIEASIRLFLAKGYAGATTNEIADSAGVSKGGLYWYFKSKEDILGAILDRYSNEYIEEITRRVNGCSGDFVTKFKMFYKFSSEFGRDNRELLLAFTLLLMEFAGSGTELERRMKRINNTFILIIQKMLEDGIREGTVGKDINAAIYARFCASTLVGSLVQWYLGNWAYENDPAYDRRHALIQRDALLKAVLSVEPSTTSGSIKRKSRARRDRRAL
jgi:AcrR family transcriptional regulator